MTVEPAQMRDYKTQRFLGHRIQQNWHALYVLERVLHDHPVDVIIELGTGSGALATFFSYHATTHSFDLYDQRTIMGRYHWIQDDVFSGLAYRQIRLMTKYHRTLFFLDDGDKPRELATYALLVKGGDLMMVHDYLNPLQRHPVTLDSIPDGLEPYRQDEFDRMETSILCLRKKTR